MSRSQHNSGTFSGTSSSGTSGSKAQKSDPEHREKMNRPLSFGDARVFFPESFVIPRQRPEVIIKSAYSIRESSFFITFLYENYLFCNTVICINFYDSYCLYVYHVALPRGSPFCNIIIIIVILFLTGRLSYYISALKRLHFT